MALLVPLLAGCRASVLDPKGPVGAAERTLIVNALAIMLCIVVPTILATLGFAWWFRASNPKAKRLPDWSFSGRIELVTWSVPLLTIIFLGGIAWISAHELDPGKPLDSTKKPLDVQVVSLDWKWLFIYPEQKIASVNLLMVPAGTPVHFTLTSASVWDSFFIPGLGSMIYTMAGMTTGLYLQADQPGSYRGLSTHLSGDGFSDMHFEMNAVADDAFSDWVKGAQATGSSLDQEAYADLAKQSVNNPPVTYRSVEPDLFRKVVTQIIPLAPGPQGGPAPTVTPKSGG